MHFSCELLCALRSLGANQAALLTSVMSPDKARTCYSGEGEEVKLEQCCLLIAFLISRNKGVQEPPGAWLNSQETPGEGLFVLNKIQEQKKSKPVPISPRGGLMKISQ